MKTIGLALVIGACCTKAPAQPSVVDAGGGKSTSARFEVVSSINDFGGVSTTAEWRVQSGFPGQLEELPSAEPTVRIAADATVIRLQVIATPGYSYQLQITSDLTHPIAWINAGAPKVAPASGLLEYTDDRAQRLRFYRVMEP